MPSKDQKTPSYEAYLGNQGRPQQPTKVVASVNQPSKLPGSRPSGVSQPTGGAGGKTTGGVRPPSSQTGGLGNGIGGAGNGSKGRGDEESLRFARQIQDEYDKQANEDYLARFQQKEKLKTRGREEEDARIARELQEQLDRELAMKYSDESRSPQPGYPPARAEPRHMAARGVLGNFNPPVFGEPLLAPGLDQYEQDLFSRAGREQPTRNRPANPYYPSPAEHRQPADYGDLGYGADGFGLGGEGQEDDEEIQRAILESMKEQGRRTKYY
jgi:hypothetical protein